MHIVCPHCETSYQVIPDYLGENGRQVRCVTCHHVWFEEPRRPDVDAAAAFDDIWPPLQAELPSEPRPASPISQADQIWLEEHETPATGFSHDSWRGLGATTRHSDDLGGNDLGSNDLDSNALDSNDLDSDYLSSDQLGGDDLCGDSSGSDDPRSDPGHGNAFRYEAEPTAAEPYFAAPPAGREIGKTKAEVTTYTERLEDRRSFRRPIPARRSGSRRRMSTAKAVTPALICILIVALAALVTARQQVVRHLPQTASLYRLLGLTVNLRGLQFDNIKTASELQEGVPVLVIEGDIVGTGRRTTAVPRLRFAVTDRAGNEIYAWTSKPDRSLLPPGESLPFRSRLASPPAEAFGVTVRFSDGHDAVAGLM